MTTTTYLHLSLPTFDSRTWHNDVNGNMGIIDAYLETLQAQVDAIVLASDAVGNHTTAVNGNFPVFDGTTGKWIKDAGYKIDTDAALTANSDFRMPSQKAIRSYTASMVNGPASAVDGNIALFDTTSGKLLKDSGLSTSSFVRSGNTTLTGDLDFNTFQIKYARLTSIRETAVSVSIVAGAITLDLLQGNVFYVTLTSNVTSVTFANVPSTGSVPITIEVTQDGTGGRTITWPASVKWPGGTAPTITSAANAVDVISGYTRNGGTTIRLARAHADSK